MIHLRKRQLIGLAAILLMAVYGCSKTQIDPAAMKAHAERLKEAHVFRYPLDDYFPEIPVTDTDPPKTERKELHHAAEDSFSPAGTPVYAIGDGIISYSGHARGYGGLIIIDHPDQNVYSLYGHLSLSQWRKESGKVKKGELIAYIGKAKECYTMVSHLHFGLRLGQKSDYPRWGDARWMAGYTNVRPELQGWFHPSEIIGATDSMKTWHKYIQKREAMVTGRSLHASDFKITSGKYREKDDLDQMVIKEFGDQYRLADWNDVLTFTENIEAWADSIGLAQGGGSNSLMISNDGYKIWLGRQFYISRFNHNKPKHYLAHGSINDDFICLGSWFGLSRHVLAVRK